MRKLFHHIILKIVIVLGAFNYSGCTGADDPVNLEPTISLLEATDITRNEATIAAEIVNRGTGKLSKFEFLYAPENATSFSSTESVSTPEGSVAVKLCNLKPGMTYVYYAKGTTSTATITTSPLSFTTIPNDLPSVNPAKILSTGPTGVIIEIEIPEDGGEALLSVGCDIKNITTGEISSHTVPEDDLSIGKHRLSIAGLSPQSEYALTTFASNSLGINHSDKINYKTTDAVVLTEPGILRELFDNENIQLTSISIAGPMNGTDFRFLRQMLGAPVIPDETFQSSQLTRVTLTGVDIIEGGLSYDGSRFTHKDTIDTGLFTDCGSLKELELPSSAKVIMRDALRDCTSLTCITIPAGIISLQPSAGCTSLESIEVSEANTVYCSHDGVLFDHSMTSILWFPRGKSGDFTLPSTISTISANAFSETSITSLTIPESVTVIERGAFAGSMLENITLPENLRNIPEGTFQNCIYLKNIHIGKNLEFIGNYALDGSRLEHIYLTSAIPPYASTYAFTCRDYELTKNCILHVPAASRDRYRLHQQWGKFSKIIGF
ncbi:MAG: leucine-rich repeat protein [Muribaculaceae bacterium]|nr:leucine-rich repeat protein [Muribaculaceae bacterium]